MKIAFYRMCHFISILKNSERDDNKPFTSHWEITQFIVSSRKTKEMFLKFIKVEMQKLRIFLILKIFHNLMYTYVPIFFRHFWYTWYIFSHWSTGRTAKEPKIDYVLYKTRTQALNVNDIYDVHGKPLSDCKMKVHVNLN